jgi:hypothetical protein
MNGNVISAIIGFGFGGRLIAGSRKAENPQAKLLSGVGLLLGGGASIFEHRSALLSLPLFVAGAVCFAVGTSLTIHKPSARLLFAVGWILLGSAAILQHFQYISAAVFFWLFVSGIVGLLGGTFWDRLSKLPPENRWRFCNNLLIIVAFVIFLVIFFRNVDRLGHHKAVIAVLGFMGCCVLYLSIWPIVKLLCAKPRPGRGAFVFAATYIAAFACGFLPFRGSILMFCVGMVLMWAFFIKYRALLFTSLFAPGGGLSDEFNALRAGLAVKPAAGDGLTSARPMRRKLG